MVCSFENAHHHNILRALRVSVPSVFSTPHLKKNHSNSATTTPNATCASHTTSLERLEEGVRRIAGFVGQ